MKTHNASFERLFNTMIKPQAILGMLLLFTLLYMWGDEALALFISPLKELKSVKLFTLMGVGALWVAVLGFMFVLFQFVLKKRAQALQVGFLWLCVFVPNAINAFLKVGVGRARPIMLLEQGHYGFNWFSLDSSFWSFPSSHTTTTVSLALGLWILFPKHRVWYALFAIFISISRLMLAKHYLSDVMAAAYLSVLEVGLVYVVWNRMQVKYQCLN